MTNDDLLSDDKNPAYALFVAAVNRLLCQGVRASDLEYDLWEIANYKYDFELKAAV